MEYFIIGGVFFAVVLIFAVSHFWAATETTIKEYRRLIAKLPDAIKYERLGDEISKMKSEKSGLEEYRDNLKEAIDEIRKEQKELDSGLLEIQKDFDNKQQNLLEKLDQLGKAGLISDAKKLNDFLNNSFSELDSKNKVLLEDIEKKKAKLKKHEEELKIKLEQMIKKVIDKNSKLKDFEGVREALEKEIDEKTQTLQSKTIKLNKLLSELDIAEKRYEELTEKNEKLTSDIKLIEKKKQELENEIGKELSAEKKTEELYKGI